MNDSDTERPAIAVIYEPRASNSAMDVSAAADGRYRLLWVIDDQSAFQGNMDRLLARLGTVVDVRGLSADEMVDRLEPHRPDGVVAFADSKLRSVSAVAERLGLTGNEPTVAECLTDKFLQRSALRSAGLPTPDHWRLPADLAGPQLEAVIAEIAYPAVVKPIHGAGSRDTLFVDDEGSLRAALETLDAGQGGRADEMVIEEFLTGSAEHRSPGFADYVSVESVVSHGAVSHLAVTGDFGLAEPFRETGCFLPSGLAEPLLGQVLDVAGQAIRALAITTGCVHTEIKLTPEGPRLIEVNGRAGGPIPYVLGSASGVSLLELALRLALGERLEFDGLLPCQGVGFVAYVQAPATATTITGIEGLEDLQEHPGVESIYLNRKVGEAISWRDGTQGYVFSVHGHVPDVDAARALYRFAHEQVRLSFV